MPSLASNTQTFAHHGPKLAGFNASVENGVGLPEGAHNPNFTDINNNPINDNVDRSTTTSAANKSNTTNNSARISSPPSETEVAIIGNGPSAICLSFFLAGNWPFYNGQLHPNEILQWHLSGGRELRCGEMMKLKNWM